MDIGKLLHPDSGELIIKGEEISAKIIDAELDPIKCEFYNDDCIKLNTEYYTHITLSRDNLHELLRLLTESELEFKHMND